MSEVNLENEPLTYMEKYQLVYGKMVSIAAERMRENFSYMREWWHTLASAHNNSVIIWTVSENDTFMWYLCWDRVALDSVETTCGYLRRCKEGTLYYLIEVSRTPELNVTLEPINKTRVEELSMSYSIKSAV